MRRVLFLAALASALAVAESADTKKYIVRVRADALGLLDSVILPQLAQLASSLPDGVAEVYAQLRGAAFDGIAIQLSQGVADAVTSMPWVAAMEIDAIMQGSGPGLVGAASGASLSAGHGDSEPSGSSGFAGGRRLQTGAPSPAAPRFTQNSAPYQLDRIDQRNADTDGKYHASLSGAGIDIYIMDSGINTGHNEFRGRIADGANFDPDQPATDVSDCNGHGTHVSALAAGTTYGAAKNATIIPVRVYGCDNAGPVSQVLAGVNYVLARMRTSGKRSVINMSFGGERVAALDNAVQALVNAGGVVVAAAGNEGQDACGTSPGGAASALTVGASDKSDKFASFSNYGSCVDIIAPGASIKSAWIGSPSATQTLSGTSMASPLTAGVAALLLESNSGLSASDVAANLACSATTGVLKNLPNSATPDKLLYSPPGGFTGGCVTSGALPRGSLAAEGLLGVIMTGMVGAALVMAWRVE